MRKGGIPSLGAQNSALPAAWVPTAVEHPLCRGPLRRVLRALAPALADVPHSGGAPPEGEPLGPKAEAVFQELRDQLGATFPRAVVRGAGADGTFAVTQPLTVVMGQRAEDLEVAELRFLVGRALEQARSRCLRLFDLLGLAYQEGDEVVATNLAARGLAFLHAHLLESPTDSELLT